MSSEPTPVLVLREGTQRTTGRDARRNNILAAKVVAETVRTTLGPRGMDKMLVSSIGDVIITNDGATIMKELDIQHPAAKMLVEVAKTQDSEVGDGTTTVVVLTGELLEKAEKLLDKDIHPTVMAEGYKKAAEKAKEILERLAESIDANDAETLQKIAMTAMGTKGVTGAKDCLAKIAVDAVLQVKDSRDGKMRVDVDLVKVLKKHGKSLEETELVLGIVIDKEIAHPQMAKRTQNARIALLNAKLEIEKTEFDARINIDNPDQMKLFLDEEERMLKEMVDNVAESGANFVFCEKSIDDVALHFLAKKGIAAVKNVSSGDMEKLAKATGGKIVASVKDLTSECLGEAKIVEENRIGEDKLVYVRDAKNPQAVTIVLRGGTEQVVTEAERGIHDALCVVRDVVEDAKIVAGGGAAEAEGAKQLREYAVKVGGREQLAIEAFADALESVPLALAENAGLDPIDIMVELRAKHQDPKNFWYGVDVFSGEIKDMRRLSVLEPLRVKLQVVKSATEAAVMILRIDDVVAAKGISKEGKEPKPPEPTPGLEEFS